MTTWWFIIALGVLVAAALALVFMIVHNNSARKQHKAKNSPKNMGEGIDEQVDHIFDDEFREELRNRGRLHFEKIIGENAMFLQQDLRLTTSQLNEYMKTEITRKLKEEFTKYEESIMDAKQLAVDSIEKTNAAVEDQRKQLGEELLKQVAEEKAHLISRFETDMARIVNHYVLEAIGDQIDLSDQLGYIISELEANKKEILKDIANG
jgi:MFS superfamily sulfate permease-like transporter